jgi:hypothetical protein
LGGKQMTSESAPHPTTAPESSMRSDSGGVYPTATQRGLALQFYSSARDEIVRRLSVAEHGVFAYLATLGVVVALAETNAEGGGAICIIPFLIFGFALVISRNLELVRCLKTYIRDELNPALDQPNVPSEVNDACGYPETVNHWDNAAAKLDKLVPLLRGEGFVSILLFCGPSLVATILTADWIVYSVYGVNVYWWPLNAALVAATFWILVRNVSGFKGHKMLLASRPVLTRRRESL